MKTDLVLSPFNADLREIVDLARAVDELDGFDGLWTYDHFSGSMVGASWSRDPFVTLGAIAAVTRRIRIGVLVANMTNRHPAQLASAVNSLQSLAPGRVTCGIGAGAAPESRFADEHSAIGQTPADGPTRAAHLVETIQSLRALWSGQEFRGDHVDVNSPHGILDDHPAPPIIVGATSAGTIALAAEHADGVNIRETPALAERVRTAQDHSSGPHFEISVMTDLDPDHPQGGDSSVLAELGAHRRILAVAGPLSLRALQRIAGNL